MKHWKHLILTIGIVTLFHGFVVNAQIYPNATVGGKPIGGPAAAPTVPLSPSVGGGTPTGGTQPEVHNITPLAPIIGTLVNENCDKTSATDCKTNYVVYLKGLFQLIIALSSIAAVIMITVGGFQYMLSASELGKTDGMDRIKNSLIGLAIALSSYLILYTINPDLTGLNNIKSVTPNLPGTPTTFTPSANNGKLTPAQQALINQVKNNINSPRTPSTPNPTIFNLQATTYDGVSTENNSKINSVRLEVGVKLNEYDGNIRLLIGEGTTKENILQARQQLQKMIDTTSIMAADIDAITLNPDPASGEVAAKLEKAKTDAKKDILDAVVAKSQELKDAIDYRDKCNHDTKTIRVGRQIKSVPCK